MAAYPPPTGPPPPHNDFDPEGYPTHNPYAAQHGYAYAPDQPEMRPAPHHHATNHGSGGGRRTGGGGGAFQNLVQRGPLRGIVMFTASLSALYLFVAAYYQFRAIGRATEPGSLKVFDGIEGGLFVAAGVIEVFGFFAALKAIYRLVRLYSFGSVVSYACILAAELLGIIVAFTHRQAIIDACTTRNIGRTSFGWDNGWWETYDDDIPINRNGTTITGFTQDEARAWCTQQYNRYRPWSIVWFIATAFMGALFVALSFAFARQLLDPAYGRSQVRVAPSARFRAGAGAAGAGAGAGANVVPELRYDNSYPMHSSYAAGGRNSTDSDGAWDSRDAKSPAYDPYSYGGGVDDDDAYAKRNRSGAGAGADVDANTLVGDEDADRKAKFGASSSVGHGREDDDDERRPGSSRGVRPADNPV
ncbi:hypothetical protein V8E36_001871 [Tilletia maclaganii]